MQLRALLRLFIFVITFQFSALNSYGEDTTTQSTNSPCVEKANESPKTAWSTVFSMEESYKTLFSVVQFVKAVDGRTRWICYDGKILLSARPSRNDYHSFVTYNGNHAFELIMKGKDVVKKDGRPVVSRIVVQEEYNDHDNYYWLLDFRQKEPKVIGPFGVGADDDYESYEVSWGKDNVAITSAERFYSFDYKSNEIESVYPAKDGKDYIQRIDIDNKTVKTERIKLK